MTELRETPLPGVGVRYDFRTRAGRAVGVVAHRTGRRDLLVYDADDPDTAASVELGEQEAQLLGQLLGGATVVERLEELPYQLEGLVIDWLTVDESSTAAGHTIAESEIRSSTGASLVAIVRNGTAIPAPGPNDELHAGDTVVVVGAPDSIARVTRLLESSGR